MIRAVLFDVGGPLNIDAAFEAVPRILRASEALLATSPPNPLSLRGEGGHGRRAEDVR